MASTYIDISGSASRLAGKTRNLIDQARVLQEATTAIKEIVDTTLDDPDTTQDTSFVTLGGLLGIPVKQGEEGLHPACQFPGRD